MTGPNNQRHAILIFVRGIPGSGKSHLIEQFAKRVGKERTLILDPDTINTADADYLAFSDSLTKAGLDKALHPFRWLRHLAVVSAKKKPVIIWGQPFTNRGIFDRLVLYIQDNAAKEGVRVDVLLVELDTPKDVAYKRITSRISRGGHGPSEATFANRVKDYASFSDGYTTMQLSGTNSADTNAADIVNQLNLIASRQQTR